MPRYYFDIENGRPHRDEVGEDLPDDAAAWRSAVRLAREIEDVLDPGGTWNLEVRHHTPLFRIEVKSARVGASRSAISKSDSPK